MSKKPWRAGKDLAAVVENMEIGTGQRGDGKDAFVTQRQLAELKLAKINASGGGRVGLTPGLGQGIFPEIPPPERPTKPQGFQVTGGFGYVLLEWVMPKYNGHSLAEVWRGTEDNLSDAVLVGTTPGQVYSDSVNPGWKGFYWIRFVNSAGVSGPYNSPDGTPAETQMDVQAVIDQIHDEAAKSPIVQELKSEIKTSSDEAKNGAIEQAALQTTEVVGGLKTDTFNALNSVNKRVTGIDNDGGKAFQAMWAQKASAAGITAGIGIVAGRDAAGNPISQVAVAASQLFIFDPNNPGNTAYPFAVSGGKVVIQKAVIYDAVVDTLAAQRIVADDVKVGATLTAPYIRSATISNGNFTVDSNGNMNAVNANLSNVTSRWGTFYDLYAVGGTMGNVHILENCQIDGRLTAAQIDGDIARIFITDGSSFYLSPQPFSRTMVVTRMYIRHGTNKHNGRTTIWSVVSVNGVIYSAFSGSYSATPRNGVYQKITIPANTPSTVLVTSLGDDSFAGRPELNHLVFVFKD